MNKFKDAIISFAAKFQGNNYVRAMSGGMMGVMGIMMVSSVATLIGAIDIWGIQEILVSSGIKALLNQVVSMTNGIISIYVAYVIAYKLGEIMDTDPLNCGIMGIMAFLIVTPLTDGALSLSSVGSGGMFVAIFSSIIAGRLYIYFVQHKLVIKMPDSVPPVVSKSFASIIPGCLVALIFGLIYMGVGMTSFGSVSNLCYSLLQKPLLAMGSNIFTCMFIVAFIEFLWFFGMHGVMVVMPILMMVFYEPQLANLAAYNAGETLPYLITMGFILGNRGARSLAVSILCMFQAKSVHLKSVGKIGFIPACFGISEPIKFGIPQIMNIRMLLPLMLTPAVCVLSAYLMSIVGFLPYHNGVSLPTGFPVIIGGFLTNGWQGIVAQIVQLILCTIIYIPFIKAQDDEALKEEEERRKELEAQGA